MLLWNFYLNINIRKTFKVFLIFKTRNIDIIWQRLVHVIIKMIVHAINLVCQNTQKRTLFAYQRSLDCVYEFYVQACNMTICIMSDSDLMQIGDLRSFRYSIFFYLPIYLKCRM